MSETVTSDIFPDVTLCEWLRDSGWAPVWGEQERDKGVAWDKGKEREGDTGPGWRHQAPLHISMY